MRSILPLLALVLAIAASPARAQTPPAPGPSADTALSTVFVGLKNGQATVTPFGASANASLAVADGKALDALTKARPGDRLDLVVDDAQAPKVVKSVATLRHSRDFFTVAGYMLLAAVLLLVFGMLATWFDVQPLIVGADNRYSNSKFQMAAWFFVLFTVYLAAILMLLFDGWLDYIGNIAIPQNLVILSGLSALTFGAAKAITVTKVQDAKTSSTAAQAAADGPAGADADPAAQAPAAAAQAPNTQGAQAAAAAPGAGAAPAAADPPTPAQQNAANRVLHLKVRGARRPQFRDLVRDDEGCLDLGDFQALFITVLALVVYLISGYAFLAQLPVSADIRLPDVDTALLSVFGLGQGAYLIKKAVSPAGKG